MYRLLSLKKPLLRTLYSLLYSLLYTATVRRLISPYSYLTPYMLGAGGAPRQIDGGLKRANKPD